MLMNIRAMFGFCRHLDSYEQPWNKELPSFSRDNIECQQNKTTVGLVKHS